MTGGGDCPGLNAVIRVVTKAAINELGAEVWGIEDGYLGLIRNRMRVLDWQDVSNILTAGGTILGTSNRADPARFAVGQDASGKPIFEDVTNRVIEHIAERALDVVVCIGGDGTMTGAAGLIKHGVRCVGVPKTIDNDLMSTDLTFGFTTAAQTATECLDRIHSTASSHHRVMLVELMGRNAGWLTLHAGLASGSDVILIPEIPYDVDAVCEECLRRSQLGKRFTLIAISEGAGPKGGHQTVEKIVHDSPDPVRLGGGARSWPLRSRRRPTWKRGPRSSATFSAAARRGRTTAFWRPRSATRPSGSSRNRNGTRWWCCGRGVPALCRSSRLPAHRAPCPSTIQ
jgi:6-phosphofructokinase 1